MNYPYRCWRVIFMSEVLCIVIYHISLSYLISSYRFDLLLYLTYCTVIYLNTFIMAKKVFPRFDTSAIVDVPPAVIEKKIDIPEKHTDAITSVTISTNNEWLVTASFDNTCVIWEFRSGLYEHSFLGHSDRVTGVAFFSDNERVVSCSLDQTIQIWKVETAKTKRTLLGHSSGIQTLALSADNTHLVTGSWDNTCIVWKLDTYSILQTLSGHTGWVKGVAISRDNSFVVSGSADCTCIIWNTSSGVALEVLRGHDSQVNSVALTPDASTAISASSDGTVKLWRVASGELVSTLSGHSDAVMAIAVNPAGSHVLSAGADRSVKCWDLKSLDKPRTLKGHTATVLCVISTADGDMILSGGSDVCVKVWGATGSTKCVRTVSGEEEDGPAVEEEAKDSTSDNGTKTKKKKKKGQEEKPSSRRGRRRRNKEEETEVLTVENDHSFLYATKAGLYEIKEMVNRMAARIAIIDGLSGWEKKDFAETVKTIGEAIGAKVAKYYSEETTEVCVRIMGHTLRMMERVANDRPVLIATSFDVTVARLLRDMYKKGMLDAINDMQVLIQKLPVERMNRAVKCLERIDGDLFGEERAAEKTAAAAEESRIKAMAGSFVSS
jgi:hypothetical protein